MLNVTIVVLLADLNQTFNEHIVRLIKSKFPDQLDTGCLRVIVPPLGIYPDFGTIKSSFHDSTERLIWRSKQNIDFAYLFLYSQNISLYYVQIEDDVVAATNYSNRIKAEIDQLQSMGKLWFMLEFSRLGFIGKLFHNSDLASIAKRLLTSFAERPGDLLIGEMRRWRRQSEPIHADVSLFQHIGRFSSLANKMMPSLDATFKDFTVTNESLTNIPRGDNPAVAIHTNFKSRSHGSDPYLSYDGNSFTYFRSDRVRVGDYLLLRFLKPQNISRIIVNSGDVYTKVDSLPNSSIYACSVNLNSFSRSCGSLRKLLVLIDGDIDTKAVGVRVPENVIYLKLLANTNSRGPVQLRDIEIFIK